MVDFSIKRRADNCIAQGALTNSKRPQSYIQGIYPTHIVKGSGCQLLDNEGNWYVDFICGLGTNILGYGDERVARQIIAHVRDGYSHSMPTVYEVELAELLKEVFTFTDAWKFLKSGSEACSAAVRIARAATGRRKILSEGYHGWHDSFCSLTPPACGCPDKHLLGIELLSMHAIDNTVAAVIIEPVNLDHSDERLVHLNEIKKQCEKVGALLIFDEVITGFRWPRLSVSTQSSVHPDLIVVGKAMANGMPIAAVGGKAELMHNDQYFVSSTYAGEILSIAAAKATIQTLRQTNFVEQLWENGARFLRMANERLAPTGVQISGYPTRGAFTGDQLAKALVFQEACLARILFGPSWFWNARHNEHETIIMIALEDIARRVSSGNLKLMGDMPSSPFAAKVRNGK